MGDQARACKEEGYVALHRRRTCPEIVFNAKEGKELIADEIVEDEDQYQWWGVTDCLDVGSAHHSIKQPWGHPHKAYNGADEYCEQGRPYAELYGGDEAFEEQVGAPTPRLRVMVDHVGGYYRPIPVVVERKEEAIGNVGEQANNSQEYKNVEWFNCRFISLHNSLLNVGRVTDEQIRE